MLLQHNVYIPAHETILNKLQELSSLDPTIQKGGNRRARLLAQGESYIEPFVRYLKLHLSSFGGTTN